MPSTGKPAKFKSECGNILPFALVYSLIEKGIYDEHGDAHIVLEGIRYETTSFWAWQMYLETVFK